MSRYWSDLVSDLSPYVAGEQPKIADLLKLNTNENPYGPSPKAIEAIRAAAGDRLKLYPDNESIALRDAIARLYGLDRNQVFVGNGSDEVLAHVFNGLFRHEGRSLWLPDITYSFYRSFCALFRIPVQLVPLADDYALNPADYTGPHAKPPAGIIFSNPNAPTGIAISLSDVESIARANPDTPVVVDEAYVDFGCESSVSLLKTCPNLVVVHTLSKSRSLAGLRVGYAMASPEIVEGLVRVKDSFNSYPLDTLAQAGAIAAIEDTDYFNQTCQAVVATRETLTHNLTALGFEVLPSKTNFVFARHPRHDAADLSRALRDQRILVRHFRQPRIDQFLRITVGTPDDCARLCKVLSGIVK
ncbi:histidinol-phosphate transaminase [Allopusillimonas ginsengisoli]|uniref:histidinol-phosphate transaminase n=1 Tax=Allopusillimonas ginsengisoli TaxID=453575 RepID=UPI0010210FF4|nr:histidinol-phosphate transaminase [Allopusillimonas ginsengisoli]TEA77324.1 histidinol-phosphate transaminase [Allopusillimonas ginsengisoli]